MSEIKTEIITTGDGSHTLYRKDLDETYHSTHGAIQESLHVYIKNGLNFLIQCGFQKIRVFELGLGTHLNAMLTRAHMADHPKVILEYDSIEKYPITPEQLIKLNYWDSEYLVAYKHDLQALFESPWDVAFEMAENFKITKIHHDFFSFAEKSDYYDLFYFDAFGYRAQEELWTQKVFQKAYKMLAKNGVLVTYAAKGLVRRNMEAVGFEIERLEGAPGKREMLRATKR
jgi:tRNA U34 5-methylaminomethyl-2-thiouridine-forming methyltransferase MnmC